MGNHTENAEKEKKPRKKHWWNSSDAKSMQQVNMLFAVAGGYLAFTGIQMAATIYGQLQSGWDSQLIPSILLTILFFFGGCYFCLRGLRNLRKTAKKQAMEAEQKRQAEEAAQSAGGEDLPQEDVLPEDGAEEA